MAAKTKRRSRDASELRIHQMKDRPPERVPEVGHPASYTCPDCGGPVSEVKDGTVLRFRCQVGHGFSAHALLLGKMRDSEYGLWHLMSNAMEGVRLAEMLEKQARRERLKGVARRFRDAALRLRTLQRSFQAVVQDLPDLSLESLSRQRQV